MDHEVRKALRENDWSLNVRDEFKGMGVDDIKKILQSRIATRIIKYIIHKIYSDII